MRSRAFALLLALSSMAFCADYQVVIKSSGNVIHGDYLYEDETTITVKVGEAEVRFRKDKLDLGRMRDFNRTKAVATTSGQSPLPSKDAWLNGIRKVERQIAEREEALGRYRQQAQSAARDRKIRETEEELRLMRSARQDLKLENGTAESPELVRLWKISNEAFVDADEAQRAYDSLPPGAPQSEVDARWKRFRAAEKKWQDAHDAVNRAAQGTR